MTVLLKNRYLSRCFSIGTELLSSVADYGEVLSLQGSTADETAVDVSLSKEACSIACVAGSAVLDRDSLCALLAVELCDDAADELANFFSLLVCSCLTCSDSPDRLVSDRDLAELVSRDILNAATI